MKAALWIVGAVALVGLVFWWSIRSVMAIGGLTGAGWIALGLGGFFSIAVGVGLMFLLFHSSRHGYDERGQEYDIEPPVQPASKPPRHPPEA